VAFEELMGKYDDGLFSHNQVPVQGLSATIQARKK
jgi:hypothetical protein